MTTTTAANTGAPLSFRNGESLFREFWPRAVPTGFSRMRRHFSIHTWSFGGEQRPFPVPNTNHQPQQQQRIASLPLLRPSMVVLGDEEEEEGGGSAETDHLRHPRFPAREQDLLERCMECEEFGPQFVEVARQVFTSLLLLPPPPSPIRTPPSARHEEVAYIRCAFWTQLLLYDVDSVLFPC